MRSTNIFFLGILLFICSTAAFGQNISRIKFPHGATATTVSGHLNSYRSKQTYLLRVRPGQTIRTGQTKTEHSTHYITIYITDPSGQEVGDSDASCNDRREISPTIAGDYRIRVVECQKADPWQGAFHFRVSVR